MTEERLFVVYWNDGYTGGPIAELHGMESIRGFTGTDGENEDFTSKVDKLGVGEQHEEWGIMECVKVWRVE